MARKKVKLAFIANDSTRKATFKKRKKGLLKKVNELSTLCGINACAIIFSLYDTNPEVWPSNSGVQRVVSDLRALPEMDQHKKMVDQETFLRQRIAKASELLKRQRKDNRELEMTEVMFQCLVGNMGMFHLNIMDLNDLGYLIEQFLKDVNRRIEILENSNIEIVESSYTIAAVDPSKTIGSFSLVAATTAPADAIHGVGSSSTSATAATFFNHMQHFPHHQQQFRHPLAPHVGFFEQHQNPLFMEMMNHPGQMSHAADQMDFPFMDYNHHHNQVHQQQQQILGDSSTAPTAANTISITPVTSSNPTNNIWFH